MQGRGSGKVRDFALYGETTGETDEFGLPVRYNWAAEYRGPGDGRLRPHAGPRAGVAQPHGQHRHRLRLRRQADRPALPGEGVRLGPGRADLLRAGPAVPARRAAGPGPVGAAGPRRGARRRGRAGQADRPDPAAGQRHDPRGERHGGPGGDEPVRRRPEVADLPAAHHVAVRDEPRAGPAGAPGRGVRLLPQPGRPAGRLRGEAHGVAGRGRSSAGTRRRRGSGSASTTGELGIVYTRTGRRFFNDADLERRSSTGCATALTAAGFWDELETTGPASTAS